MVYTTISPSDAEERSVFSRVVAVLDAHAAYRKDRRDYRTLFQMIARVLADMGLTHDDVLLALKPPFRWRRAF